MITPKEALSRAESRCAMKEMCLYDVRNACLRWGLSADEAESVLQRLEASGYIDENRYARAFAHDKAHFDRWGPLKIRAALRAKRVSESDIREALALIPDSIFTENLQAAIASKRRTISEKDPHRLRDKLARHALARGYKPHLVFKELDGDF